MLRGRLYLRILATAIPILAVGDLLFRQTDWPALLLVKGSVEAFLLFSLRALRRPGRTRAIGLCLAGTAAFAAGTVTAGWLASDPPAALLSLGAVALLAAATLPWGLTLQGAATAIASLGALATELLATQPPGRPLVAALFAFTVGLFVAHGLERQQRRALEATRRRAGSAATLQALLRHAPDAILIVDEAGRIEFSNRRFAPRAQIDPVGRPLFDFLVEDEHAAVRRQLASVVATGTAATFESTSRFGAHPHLYRCRMAPLRRPGERPAVILIASDVTAERRAELARQESREVAAALTGVGRRLLAALTGKDLIEELCAATAVAVPCKRCRILSTEGPWPGSASAAPLTALLAGEAVELTRQELRTLAPSAIPPEGDPAEPRLLAVLLRLGGDVLGLLVTERDDGAAFTGRDRRALIGVAQLAALALRTSALVRELREANTVNSYFAATMSHEIRNQLASVVGYAQLVLEERGPDDPLSSDGVFFLERIRDRGQEALGVIASALEASRTSDGRRVIPDRDEIDVAQLFSELVEELHSLRNGSGPRLVQSVEPGLGALRSDRVKLRMILKNLTSNALKFTHEGEIRLSARRDGDQVVLAVADTGVGIPATQLPDVFKPFAQAHGRLSRDSGGTGLGLFIVQRLVEMLGGEIRAESANTGATFTITLPQPRERTEETSPPAPIARSA